MRRHLAVLGGLLAALFLVWPEDDASILGGPAELAALPAEARDPFEEASDPFEEPSLGESTDVCPIGEPVEWLEEEPLGVPVEAAPFGDAFDGSETEADAFSEEPSAAVETTREDEIFGDEDLDAGPEEEDETADAGVDDERVDDDEDEDVSDEDEDTDEDAADELPEDEDIDEVEPARSLLVERGVATLPAEGVTRGTVTRKLPHALVIDADGPPTRIEGTPWDFRGISVGDVASLTYRTVGGQRWIWPVEPEEDRPSVEAYNVRGTVTGPITVVDRSRGMLQVGRLWIRSHPADLDALDEGQIVEVRYVQVEGRLWVHGVEVTER